MSKIIPNSENLEERSVPNEENGKILISDIERLQLEEQVRKFVQLLTQFYLLSFGDSKLDFLNVSSKQILMELKGIALENSMFSAHNLKGAIDIVEEYEANRKTYQLKTNPRGIPHGIRRKILNSEVFMYPELLPKEGFIGKKKTLRQTFTKAEDNLIALGLERFLPQFPFPRDIHAVAQLIQTHLIPCKINYQIRFRIKNLKASKSPKDNPVKYFYTHKEAPPMPRIVQFFDPSKVKAPKDYPCEYLPDWMMPSTSSNTMCTRTNILPKSNKLFFILPVTNVIQDSNTFYPIVSNELNGSVIYNVNMANNAKRNTTPVKKLPFILPKDKPNLMSDTNINTTCIESKDCSEKSDFKSDVAKSFHTSVNTLPSTNSEIAKSVEFIPDISGKDGDIIIKSEFTEEISDTSQDVYVDDCTTEKILNSNLLGIYNDKQNSNFAENETENRDIDIAKDLKDPTGLGKNKISESEYLVQFDNKCNENNLSTGLKKSKTQSRIPHLTVSGNKNTKMKNVTNVIKKNDVVDEIITNKYNVCINSKKKVRKTSICDKVICRPLSFVVDNEKSDFSSSIYLTNDKHKLSAESMKTTCGVKKNSVLHKSMTKKCKKNSALDKSMTKKCKKNSVVDKSMTKKCEKNGVLDKSMTEKCNTRNNSKSECNKKCKLSKVISRPLFDDKKSKNKNSPIYLASDKCYKSSTKPTRKGCDATTKTEFVEEISDISPNLNMVRNANSSPTSVHNLPFILRKDGIRTYCKKKSDLKINSNVNSKNESKQDLVTKNVTKPFIISLNTLPATNNEITKSVEVIPNFNEKNCDIVIKSEFVEEINDNDAHFEEYKTESVLNSNLLVTYDNEQNSNFAENETKSKDNDNTKAISEMTCSGKDKISKAGYLIQLDNKCSENNTSTDAKNSKTQSKIKPLTINHDENTKKETVTRIVKKNDVLDKIMMDKCNESINPKNKFIKNCQLDEVISKPLFMIGDQKNKNNNFNSSIYLTGENCFEFSTKSTRQDYDIIIKSEPVEENWDSSLISCVRDCTTAKVSNSSSGQRNNKEDSSFVQTEIKNNITDLVDTVKQETYDHFEVAQTYDSIHDTSTKVKKDNIKNSTEYKDKPALNYIKHTLTNKVINTIDYIPGPNNEECDVIIKSEIIEESNDPLLDACVIDFDLGTPLVESSSTTSNYYCLRKRNLSFENLSSTNKIFLNVTEFPKYNEHVGDFDLIQKIESNDKIVSATSIANVTASSDKNLIKSEIIHDNEIVLQNTNNSKSILKTARNFTESNSLERAHLRRSSRITKQKRQKQNYQIKKASRKRK